MDSERLARRFDAWEARMRGQSSRPYRVAIEPEYCPLLGRQRIHRGIVDDARRPGFFERVLEQPKRRATQSEPEPIPEPVPFEGSGETVELQLLVRPDASFPNAIGAALLASLSGTSHHLAFEVLAVGERVVVQITCDEVDLASVRGSLRAHAPNVRVAEARDYLGEAWYREEAFAVIAPFALSERVFRSLRTAKEASVDPLAEIIGRMDTIDEDETLLLQVLFAPVRAPWRKDLEEFVSCIEDVDHVLPQIREKFSEPLFASVIRIAGCSPSDERAVSRARALADALVSQTESPRNRLVLSRAGKVPFEDDVADLIARQTRRHGMILSLSELQTLVHLPSASVRSERLVRQTGRTKAAPVIASGHALVLGTNEHDGDIRIVSLSPEQRSRHVYAIGASGTGKSTMLLSMAAQDIAAGNGFAVLDPHGDLVDDILARIPEERAGDVILFDPADEAYPIGFNILSAHSELERTLLASDLVSVFKRLSTTFGDVMVSVLGNAALAFLESSEGGTLLDLRNFLIDPSFRARVLKTVRDEEVASYWTREFPLLKGVPHAPVLTRLNTFLRPKLVRRMVAQKKDRLDFRRIMDGKKIFLAKLSQGAIGEENSYLLGSLLVSKITQAAMSRQNIENARREPYTLYIDEFHHFVTPSIATILSGARKYGLGLVLAHQEMRQLRSRNEDVASAVLANAATRVVFRVGEQDARALADGLSFFEAKDLQNLDVGRAIARVERADFDFNLRTERLEPVAGEIAAAQRAAVQAQSRATYGTPSEEVDAVLHAVRTTVANEPMPNEPVARKTKKPAPTGKIEEALSLPGRGGAQHKYLQSLVRRLAEDRGFEVSLEKTVLDGHGHIDVALEGYGVIVACEISVTTKVEHEVGNLTKCLAAGFDYAVLISSDERTLDLARAEMSGAAPKRIRIVTPGAVGSFLDELAGGAPITPQKRSRSPEVSTAPDPNAGKHVLVTDDAAAYLGLAKQTLAKMRVSGESPPFHKLGRRVVYDRKDLDEWLAQRKRRSTSDSGQGHSHKSGA